MELARIFVVPMLVDTQFRVGRPLVNYGGDSAIIDKSAAEMSF